QACPLGAAVAEATGCDVDRAGRVLVEPELSIPGYPEMFVIGDLAHCKGSGGEPLPGLAPVAIQQGRYVAAELRDRLLDKERNSTRPFRYTDRGKLATVGRGVAVADLGRLQFDGFVAWVVWLFVHLMQIIGFQSRALVLVQWGWSYLTWSRSARLVTGDDRENSHRFWQESYAPRRERANADSADQRQAGAR
ncbi:MAG: hypothetical protein KDD44_04870, partial [Bdellovibrionales bacterium]|nr:hypothetical protein [Bdellovibrionales bacterium]